MKKNNKYTLLAKQDKDEYDGMIQLQDFSIKKQYPLQQQAPTYQKLEDDQPPKTNNLPNQPTQSKPSATTTKNRSNQAYQQSQFYQQKPKTSVYKVRPNARNGPVQININPHSRPTVTTYQQPKPSPIPDMKVACDQCTFEQNVPGNTQVYACCMCNNMNECYPLYGLFICGRCQTSVCYPYGTSEFIKCTRCFTVNKVPIEPKKKYIDSKVKEDKPQKKLEPKVEPEKQQQLQVFEEELQFDEPEKKQQEKEPKNHYYEDYPDL